MMKSRNLVTGRFRRRLLAIFIFCGAASMLATSFGQHQTHVWAFALPLVGGCLLSFLGLQACVVGSEVEDFVVLGTIRVPGLELMEGGRVRILNLVQVQVQEV